MWSVAYNFIVDAPYEESCYLPRSVCEPQDATPGILD